MTGCTVWRLFCVQHLPDFQVKLTWREGKFGEVLRGVLDNIAPRARILNSCQTDLHVNTKVRNGRKIGYPANKRSKDRNSVESTCKRLNLATLASFIVQKSRETAE